MNLMKNVVQQKQDFLNIRAKPLMFQLYFKVNLNIFGGTTDKITEKKNFKIIFLFNLSPYTLMKTIK